MGDLSGSEAKPAGDEYDKPRLKAVIISHGVGSLEEELKLAITQGVLFAMPNVFSVTLDLGRRRICH